ARLHRELQAHEPEWRVLQALYATPETVRGEAIDRLAALTRAPGGYCCRRVWIGCWASPALAQKYGTKTLDWD
ncbi:hypothetical protein ACSTLI_23220, partial [Vibrio parahaemolyticus]